MNEKAVRALFDNDTITIYQAYNETIAKSALEHQKFTCPPFKKERMTWIKPSFLWMMYRSGWASKENQEFILAIKIKREGFEWALKHACISHFDKVIYNSHNEWKERLVNSPVRIQWDPEKDILLNPLPYRSIQIGLSGIAVEKYMSEWVVKINDITEYCKNIKKLISNGEINKANNLLPNEQLYSLSEYIKINISAT